MARGSNQLGNLKLFFMKITGLKKGEKVYIKQTECRGEKDYVVLEEKLNQVSGKVHEIRLREYTYEGDEIEELNVWLRDDAAKEMYCVQCGINSIGRSIINTLLNIEGEIGELLIRVYNKDKNGQSYPSVYVEHNQEKVGWKYDVEQQNQHVTETKETKKIDGKIVTVVKKNYLELNEFLLAELKQNVMTKTPVAAGEPTSDTEQDHVSEPEQDHVPDAPGTGLPF